MFVANLIKLDKQPTSSKSSAEDTFQPKLTRALHIFHRLRNTAEGMRTNVQAFTQRVCTNMQTHPL